MLLNKNTIALSLEKAVKIITTVLGSALIARSLGEYDFGTISFYISITTIGWTLATFGLNTISIDLLHREKSIYLLRSILQIRLASAILISIISLSIFAIFDRDNFPIILILSLRVFFSPLESYEYLFKSQDNFKKPSIIRSIATTISFTMILLGFLNELGYIYFVIAITTEHVILNLLFWLNRKPINLDRNKTNNKIKTKEILAKAWPLATSSVAVIVYMRTDIIMIRHYYTDTEVGIYSAATRISEFSYFIPGILTQAMIPTLLRLRDLNNSEYLNVFKRTFRLLFLSSIVFSILIYLCSSLITEIIYGSQFQKAAVILSIHAFAMPFVYIGVAQRVYNTLNGNTKISLIQTIGGAIINIILNATFIPRYGIQAAAFATVISYSFSSLFINLYSRQTRKTFFIIIKSIYPF